MGVTVINKFVVPEEAVEAFLDEFSEHRAFLAAQPGFLSGALYRKAGGPGRFNLVNRARWESAGHLAAAREALGKLYEARGSDPGALYRRLGVEADIASYSEIVTY